MWVKAVIYLTACAASIELTGSTAPEWVHLLPIGTVMGRDGRGPYTVRDKAHATQIVAATLAYQRGADIPVDYEHQSELSASNGHPAPASGWIKELSARDDGIWGRVEWVATARANIEAKAYRYLSPAFIHTKDGTVLRLKSAGLTNLPNFSLTALASQSGPTTEDQPTMDLIALAKAHGLPDTATEAEITAAAQAQTVKLKEAEAKLALQTQQVPPPVTSSIPDPAPDPAKYVPIEAMTALQQQVAAMSQSLATDKAAQAVAKAKAEGKVPPALEAWATSFATQSPEGFTTWASQAPVIIAPGAEITQPAASSRPAMNSPEMLAVCAQLDLDPAALTATGKDQTKESK